MSLRLLLPTASNLRLTAKESIKAPKVRTIGLPTASNLRLTAKEYPGRRGGLPFAPSLQKGAVTKCPIKNRATFGSLCFFVKKKEPEGFLFLV